MIRFASAAGDGTGPPEGAAVARKVREELGDVPPKLAIAFVSSTAADVDGTFQAIHAELGDVPVVGGCASGAVVGGEGGSEDGVSVLLLGGDLEVATRAVKLSSESRLEVVPAAAELVAPADEAASRGLSEFLCLVFAPGVGAGGDGDVLVAAIRKGVGQRARLAGAMTGHNLTFDRGRVFTGHAVASDSVVLAGVFSRTAFGIAARHGWQQTGPARRVTRSEGPWLIALDGKPAFEVWCADARAAGVEVPVGDPQAAVIWLANHCALSVREGDRDEPIIRIPLAVRKDGAVRLSGGVGEAARTRIMRGTKRGLLDAARIAARVAASEVRGPLAGGIILTCGSRFSLLGAHFAEEADEIAMELGAAVGGACVFGEIARAHRETEAFHNATVVVIAVPAD